MVQTGPGQLPSKPLLKRIPMHVELARNLMDYLLSGAVAPNQRLPGERALSEALGVSRSLLRDAIKSLSLLGLLEQRQGDGTYLSTSESYLLPAVIEWGLLFDKPEIDDLIDARCHLEVTLAGLAASRRDADSIARLRLVVKKMQSCVASDDLEGYVAADVEFHLAVAHASGSPVLSNFLANISVLLEVWARKVIFTAGETKTSIIKHTPILDAIEAGDKAAACAAMEAHMERAKTRLLASVSQPPVDGTVQTKI